MEKELRREGWVKAEWESGATMGAAPMQPGMGVMDSKEGIYKEGSVNKGKKCLRRVS